MTRLRTIARWLWPLLALAGTIWAIRNLWFDRHLATARTDAELLVYIGACYVVAIAFLLACTRSWSLRSLGQVATYSSDAALYLGAGGAQLGWWGALGGGDLNVIRAGFAVGGTLLVIGLGAWVAASRRARIEETT